MTHRFASSSFSHFYDACDSFLGTRWSVQATSSDRIHARLQTSFDLQKVSVEGSNPSGKPVLNSSPKKRTELRPEPASGEEQDPPFQDVFLGAVDEMVVARNLGR